MSNIAPSPNRAKAQGHRLDRRPYPQGVAGVKLSLEEIARRVREGRLDPDVRGWAGDVLIKAGRPTSVFSEATAILDAFRQMSVYMPDPVGAEMNVSAAGTLCLRPGLCVRAFDCDDGVIAVGSALMSVGIPVRIVKQTFGANDQEHVLLEAQDENGGWLAVDPSTDKAVGQKINATSEFVLDPMNPKMIGLVGVPDAEYIGIGRPTVMALARYTPRFVGATPTGAQLPASVEVSGSYDQASIDLQNQMLTPIAAGDKYYSAGEYSNAISSYQAAGMAGATSNGPAIDLVGAANVTQPMTQTAWYSNIQLQEISHTSQSQADADNARLYAINMLSQYLAAMDAGQQALSAGGVPPGGSLSLFQAALVALAGGAAAALAYEFYLARGGKPIPFPPLPKPIAKLLRV